MADKVSTLILKADLECRLCYKKIRKTLCKLQDRENIRSIAYDEKKNTVTISGPFDPKRLSTKLYDKAYKVIKDIEIVDNKEKEKPKDAKPPAQPEKEKPKPASEPAKPDKEKPKPTSEPAKPDKDKPKAMAEPAKPEKPKPSEPSKPEKEKSKPPAEPNKPYIEKPKPALKPNLPYPDQFVVAQGIQQGYPSAWPVGPACGCGPWYEAHYGGCRCYSGGGRAYGPYGYPAMGPPGEGSKAGQFFSEEDPTSACNIM